MKRLRLEESYLPILLASTSAMGLSNSEVLPSIARQHQLYGSMKGALPMISRRLTRWMAAAAAVIVVGGGAYGYRQCKLQQSLRDRKRGDTDAGTGDPVHPRSAEPNPRSWAKVPPSYVQGSGTIVTGTAADTAQAAAVAAYPGGTVDRVVLLSSGDYEVHMIAVNWPHHVFVNSNFTVIGAE
jgi:hypothetical protein